MSVQTPNERQIRSRSCTWFQLCPTNSTQVELNEGQRLPCDNTTNAMQMSKINSSTILNVPLTRFGHSKWTSKMRRPDGYNWLCKIRAQNMASVLTFSMKTISTKQNGQNSNQSPLAGPLNMAHLMHTIMKGLTRSQVSCVPSPLCPRPAMC